MIVVWNTGCISVSKENHFWGPIKNTFFIIYNNIPNKIDVFMFFEELLSPIKDGEKVN